MEERFGKRRKHNIRPKAQAHDKVIGSLSIASLFLEFIGLAYYFMIGEMFGFFDVILVSFYSYIIYRTLYKKEILELWEKIVFYILFTIVALAFVVGLMIGIMNSMYLY